MTAQLSLVPPRERGSLLNKWHLLGVILADDALGPAAKAAAYFLLNHFNGETGQCNPSYALLAKEMGTTRRTAMRAVESLLELGYFTRPLNPGGEAHSNEYTPNWEMVTAPSPSQEPETVTAVSPSEGQTVTPVSRDGDSPVHQTVTAVSPKPFNRNLLGNEKAKPSIEGEFEEWYRLYPLKVGKGGAEKAFRTARTVATFDELVAGVQRFVASEPQKGFTAHPTTWLNQKRWLDELDSAGADEMAAGDDGDRCSVRLNTFRETGKWLPDWGPEPAWQSEWGARPSDELGAGGSEERKAGGNGSDVEDSAAAPGPEAEDDYLEIPGFLRRGPNNEIPQATR